MKKNLRSKTIAQSLDHAPQALFDWLANPDNLPQWHGTLCRSVARKNGGWTATSPRGTVVLRILRNDHARLLDLIQQIPTGGECATSIRVLPNGESSEIVCTLIQAPGQSDALFH